eukprot:COSAG06_NODE_1763_length_8449_cov_184.922275_13_plen_126_part_00
MIVLHIKCSKVAFSAPRLHQGRRLVLGLAIGRPFETQHRGALRLLALKTVLFFEFYYVCPEPVLVKEAWSYKKVDTKCRFLTATVRIMRRFSEPRSMAHSPFGLESENLNSGFSTLPPEDNASLL